MALVLYHKDLEIHKSSHLKVYHTINHMYLLFIQVV